MSFEILPSFLLKSSETGVVKKRPMSYVFAKFRLDVSERRLTESGNNIPITPKAFDVLVYLVERSGHLVKKEELLENVWPDSFVEESNLARIVHTLRKLLGEDKNGNRFIETVSKKGYRFIAEVTLLDDGEQVPGEGASATDLSTASNYVTRRSWTSGFAIVGLLFAVSLVMMAAAWKFGLQMDSPRGAVSEKDPETESGAAFQEYSQGRFLVERRHKGDYEKALEHFDRALVLDPNYANALAGRADAKVVLFWASSSHQEISQARTAVRRAIEIDPNNSYARTIHCRILTTYDWDHAAAEKECLAAVAADPNDHEAQRELAFLWNSLGRDDEALQAMDRAIAIAPTSFNKRSRGVLLYHSRRYDEAIEQLQQVGQTDPSYSEVVRWLIRCHEMKKEYAKAFHWYTILMEESGTSQEEMASIRSAFEVSGWNAALKHITISSGKRTMFRAGSFAGLGEYDLAFEDLEDMFKRKAVLIITAKREPTLDPIRNDPRFADLLKRIGMDLN